MSIISHITLGTNDKDRSARFYDAVLGAIGFSRLAKPPEKPLAYERDGQMPTIYIYTPEDGRPATWGNGTHVAFIADTKAQVHSFHEQALELGGRSEGEPGPRLVRTTTQPTFATPMATNCRQFAMLLGDQLYGGRPYSPAIAGRF